MKKSPAPKNAVLIAQVPAEIKQKIFARANERGEAASVIVRELLKASLQTVA